MKQLVLEEGTVVDGRARVVGADHHYLAHVRRLTPGDRITALSGSRRYVLEVSAVASQTMELVVLEETLAGKGSTDLTLFPFLLKSGKLDDVIRQACEAGVRSIVPVEGDHSVSRHETPSDANKKLDRWKSIARQAAQQSGNSVVCEVFPTLSSREIDRWWASRGPLLVFHQLPLAKGSLHGYLAHNPAHVGLVIGPEGGLSVPELTRLRESGALPVWLGSAVLRAETANVHAVAAVNIILQERSEWTLPTESRA